MSGVHLERGSTSDAFRAIVSQDDGVGISADMKMGLFARGSGKGHGYGLFLSHEILSITGITITEPGEPLLCAKNLLDKNLAFTYS